MRGCRLALASLFGLFAACDGTPSDSDIEPAAARLHIVATFVDSVDSRIDVLAFLDPGVAASGRTREILDPVLEVAGHELRPVGRGGRPRELRYEARLEAPPGSFDETAFTFDPPPVEGVSPEFGPVRWFTFGRSGAHTITLGPGEDLTLDLDTPAGSSEPVPDFFGADLRLDAGEGNLLVLRVPLPPVDPIVVPRELLPDSESGEILARLVVTQHRSHVPEDEAYVVTPVFGARIHWRVVVLSP